MFEFTGSLSNVSISYATGKPVLSVEVNEDKSTLFKMFDELRAAERLTIKICKHTKKRSLDANAYCWVLISKLAEKLNVPKTDIYRQAIKEIGGNSDTVCVQDKAVQSLCDGWERNGIGWQTDTMPSKIDGCTNVVLYYGSSTYDTAQMSRLINSIAEDCKLQGIETKSAEEIDSLLRQWGDCMAKSILQTEKECYITGQTNNLHKHHIYFGNPGRRISEENGFWVYLAGRLHNQSEDGVHGKNGHELDLMLKRHCQMKYEETHSREEFRRLVGISYL